MISYILIYRKLLPAAGVSWLTEALRELTQIIKNKKQKSRGMIS